MEPEHDLTIDQRLLALELKLELVARAVDSIFEALDAQLPQGFSHNIPVREELRKAKVK